MNRWIRATVLSLSLMVFGYVSIGYVLGQANEDKAYRALGVFTEVLQHIQNDYVDEPNLPLVTSGALHGLLESLDPLSGYLTPKEFVEYKKQEANAAKGEIGAALSKRFGYVLVVSVLPDSPAQKAGLRAGDIIESIDRFTTRDISVVQAQLLLNGAPGTGVRVSVVRRGSADPKEIDVVRAELVRPKVESRLLAEPETASQAGIAYVRVPALMAGMSDDLRARLLALEKQGAKKLILDLRDTALGPNSEGIAAARLFVAEGKFATLRGQTVPTQEFAGDAAKVAWRHPVDVLTSASTSGPAEILAAAIAGTGRGSTVGERTYGSASEQKIIPLEDGAALLLTVANYYNVSGKLLSDDGVAPSIAADRTTAAADDDDDTPVAGAIPAPHDDAILKRAIEHLLSPNSAPPAKSDAQRRTSALQPARTRTAS